MTKSEVEAKLKHMKRVDEEREWGGGKEGREMGKSEAKGIPGPRLQVYDGNGRNKSIRREDTRSSPQDVKGFEWSEARRRGGE